MITIQVTTYDRQVRMMRKQRYHVSVSTNEIRKHLNQCRNDARQLSFCFFYILMKMCDGSIDISTAL